MKQTPYYRSLPTTVVLPGGGSGINVSDLFALRPGAQPRKIARSNRESKESEEATDRPSRRRDRSR